MKKVPKYKAGDTFACAAVSSPNLRRIESVHAFANGVWYAVSFEEMDAQELLSEIYIDDEYTKVEPFFEKGKKYKRKDYASASELLCIHVMEHDGKPHALMVWSSGSFSGACGLGRDDFRYYGMIG